MNNRETVSELAARYIAHHNPTGWFEELYSEAKGDTKLIPWANLTINPNLASWLENKQLETEGKTALVVGCGLGDDAEALANLGYRVTAFDISPSAIAWCRQRFPETQVNYVVADALELEPAWVNGFDFILEAYTLQALPETLRQQIMSGIANYLAPEGILLIICRGRDASEDAGLSPPWALTLEELAFFEQLSLERASFEDYVDSENPSVRRFRLCFLRRQ